MTATENDWVISKLPGTLLHAGGHGHQVEWRLGLGCGKGGKREKNRSQEDSSA